MSLYDEIMNLPSLSELQKVFDAYNRRWKELDRKAASAFHIGQSVEFSSAKHGKTYGGIVESINGAGRMKITIQVVRPIHSTSSSFTPTRGTFTCNAGWLVENRIK